MDTSVSAEKLLVEMHYLLMGRDTLPGGNQQLGRPDQVADTKEMPATDTVHNSLVPPY